jgi:predicted nucleic acid-binding protein
MALVEAHALAGAGIGWVDAHLLAAARLADTPLWTLDRPLRRAAERLDIYGEPEI